MSPSIDPRPIRTTVPPGLALRWMTDDDLPFLAELYASTRREEVARTPWTPEQREEFLRWQFDAQHAHYQEHYPDCEFLVVEQGGDAIGRLYVDRWPEEIRLVDIALLPEHRGGGMGTNLLHALLDEGRREGLPVSIHVEANNPAMGLYQRLGFEHVDTNGVYHLMRWSPRASSAEP